MSQLTITVETTDTYVVSEVSLMLQRLSGVVNEDHSDLMEPEQEQPYFDGELDSAGMPWDERIHASTKSKVTDGTWTFKRNLDKKLKEQVLAEYAKAGLSPKPSNAPTVKPVEERIIEETPPPPPPAVEEETPPPPPAVEEETPPPPPTVEGTVEPITTLPQFLKAVRAKGIKPQEVQQACDIVGAVNPIALGQNPAQLAEAAALLGL